jgi:hypothetical protein
MGNILVREEEESGESGAVADSHLYAQPFQDSISTSYKEHYRYMHVTYAKFKETI